MKSFKPLEKNIEINISALTPGRYTLHLRSPEYQSQIKFIKLPV